LTKALYWVYLVARHYFGKISYFSKIEEASEYSDISNVNTIFSNLIEENKYFPSPA